MISPSDVWSLLKQTAEEWREDQVPVLGAALAFYSILSLAPLLVIVIAIAAFAFGEDAAQGRVVEQLRDLVGDEGAQAVQTMIVHAKKPEAGLVATAFGVLTLFLGAAGVFGQLHAALNTVWDVQRPAHGSVWEWARARFLSVAMVFGAGFLLLVSLVLSAGMNALGDRINAHLPGLSAISQGLNIVLSFVMVTLLFALLFKALPDTPVAWRDVWLGAAATAVLFTFGKYLIGLYLGRAGLGSAYGAAGSLVVLVVWIYYSAQIVLLGAEFTQVHAKRRQG